MFKSEKRNKLALPKLNIAINLNKAINNESTTLTKMKIKTDTILSDNITYKNGPIEILPGLYLGTQRNANNVHQLSSLGIDSIINVAEEVDSNPNSPSESLNIKFKCLNLQWQHYESNIINYFDSAFEFIDQSRIHANKKVLVHCQLGVSRSATLVIAYLMYKLNYTCSEAYSFLKSKSYKISPNLHLFTQLKQYEVHLLNNNIKHTRIDINDRKVKRNKVAV